MTAISESFKAMGFKDTTMSSLLSNEETVSQTASEINEENKIVLSSLPVDVVFTIFTFLPNEKKIKDNKQTQLKLLGFNVYDRVLLRRQCRVFCTVLESPVTGIFTMFPHPNHTSLYSLLAKLHHLAEQAPKKAPAFIFVGEGIHNFNYENHPIYINNMELVAERERFFKRKSTLEEIRELASINYSVCLTGEGRGKTIINMDICISASAGVHVEIKDLTLDNGYYVNIKAAQENELGPSFLLENISLWWSGRCGIQISNARGTCRNVHRMGEVDGEAMVLSKHSNVTLCESITSVRGDPYNDDYVYHVEEGSTLRVLLPMTVFDTVCRDENIFGSEAGGVGTLEHIDSSMNVLHSISGSFPENIDLLRNELESIVVENFSSKERAAVETALNNWKNKATVEECKRRQEQGLMD